MQQPFIDTSRSKVSRWDILLYLFGGYGLYTALMTLLLATLIFSQNQRLLLQGLFQVVFLGGAVWLLGEQRGRFTWAELGLFPIRWRRSWLGWAAVGGLALAIFNLLTEQIGFWLRRGSFGKLTSFDALPWAQLALVWFCSALLIPLAEELFFRGAIYVWFERLYGSTAALIGSAALYAVTRATFFTLSSPIHVIQSLLLGLVAAYAMRRTRSLWVPIALHILTNTLALGLTILGTLL